MWWRWRGRKRLNDNPTRDADDADDPNGHPGDLGPFESCGD